MYLRLVYYNAYHLLIVIIHYSVQILNVQPRSVIRGRKDYDHFDSCSDEDDIPPSEPLESSSQLKNTEVSTESNVGDLASVGHVIPFDICTIIHTS